MIAVPYKAEHLFAMDVQPAQAHMYAAMPESDAYALEQFETYSFLSDEGEPLLCFGFLPIWAGRAVIWAYVSAKAGTEFVRVHREAKAIIDSSRFRRLEAYVDVDFEQGHRWMRLLGFGKEVDKMTAFLPDGNDATMYVRFH